MPARRSDSLAGPSAEPVHSSDSVERQALRTRDWFIISFPIPIGRWIRSLEGSKRPSVPTNRLVRAAAGGDRSRPSFPAAPAPPAPTPATPHFRNPANPPKESELEHRTADPTLRPRVAGRRPHAPLGEVKVKRDSETPHRSAGRGGVLPTPRSPRMAFFGDGVRFIESIRESFNVSGPTRYAPRVAQRDPRIWAARVQTEIRGLEEGPVEGAQVLATNLSEEDGVCQVTISLLSGGGDPVEILVDLGLHTDYPFQPPSITILSGAEALPRNMCGPQSSLAVPRSDEWVPANRLGELIGQIHAAAATGPMATAEEAAPASAASFFVRATEAMERRRKSVMEAFENLRQGRSRGLHVEEGQVLPARTVAGFGRVFACTGAGAGVLPGDEDGQRYLAITIDQAIVLRCVTNGAEAGACEAVRVFQLSNLARLKLRQGSVLTLHMKDGGAPEMQVEDARNVVRAIKEAMRHRGVQGKQTSLRRAQPKTEELMSRISQAEQRLTEEPSIAVVEMIMDLFRQALELVGAKSNSDALIESVLAHKSAFLQRADVQDILNAARPSQQDLDEAEEDEIVLPPTPSGEVVRIPAPDGLGASSNISGEVLTSPEQHRISGDDDSDDDLAREEALAGLNGDLGPGLRELRDMVNRVEADDGAISDLSSDMESGGDDFFNFMNNLHHSASARSAAQDSSKQQDAGDDEGLDLDGFDMNDVFTELDQLTGGETEQASVTYAEQKQA